MDGPNQNAQVPQGPPVVTAAQFNAKFRSKQEVFRFLSFDCGAYLPSYQTVTIFHLRDLASGKKRIIKAAAVKTIQVPHFEGLSTTTMLYHAKNFPAVGRHLPAEPREVEKLPRAYLANVIYTVVGDPFKEWVDEEIAKRNANIVKEQALAIDMDPEVYRAFMASQHVSVQHGSSGHLMKVSTFSYVDSLSTNRHQPNGDEPRLR